MKAANHCICVLAVVHHEKSGSRLFPLHISAAIGVSSNTTNDSAVPVVRRVYFAC